MFQRWLCCCNIAVAKINIRCACNVVSGISLFSFPSQVMYYFCVLSGFKFSPELKLMWKRKEKQFRINFKLVTTRFIWTKIYFVQQQICIRLCRPTTAPLHSHPLQTKKLTSNTKYLLRPPQNKTSIENPCGSPNLWWPTNSLGWNHQSGRETGGNPFLRNQVIKKKV